MPEAAPAEEEPAAPAEPYVKPPSYEELWGTAPAKGKEKRPTTYEDLYGAPAPAAAPPAAPPEGGEGQSGSGDKGGQA